MREIKFRAWDTDNRKWVQAGQQLLGYLVAWKSNDEFELHGDGFEITQSTGLKDRCGDEIF